MQKPGEMPLTPDKLEMAIAHLWNGELKPRMCPPHIVNPHPCFINGEEYHICSVCGFPIKGGLE